MAALYLDDRFTCLHSTFMRRLSLFTSLRLGGAFACLPVALLSGFLWTGSRAGAQVTPLPTLMTVAGTGSLGYSGDGGLATAALLKNPAGVAVDAAGNVYIADPADNVIRKVAARTGIISTVAGTGTAGYAGNGGPATGAELNGPYGVAVDAAGDLYIADSSNNVIREVAAGTGTLSTVVGTGAASSAGTSLNAPQAVAVDAAGNLFLSDYGSGRILMLAAGTTTVSTVVGSGLSLPAGIAMDGAHNLYIADSGNNRIVMLANAASGSGTPVPVAGDAIAGYGGDGGPATSASLAGPRGVGVDGVGNLYIADTGNNVIRRVANAATGTGTITTVAGDRPGGYNGDGIAATSAELNQPTGVAIDGAGDLYIADTSNARVREAALSLPFATIAIGGSANQTVYFSVAANTTIGGIAILTQGVPNLDFVPQAADTSTTLCTMQTYATATTCSVDVKFSPRYAGARYGAVQMVATGNNAVSTIYLQGVGTGAQVTWTPGLASTVAGGTQ
jgi:sugar lactone lactonase YvrE